MENSKEDFFEGYNPLFELGFFDETEDDPSPAVRILEEGEIGPIELAALVVALFETVMRTVPESNQIDFEEKFHKCLDVLMEERFDYDVVTKYPEDYED